ILWNFPDATKFTASGVQIDGTVLAPNANSYLDNGNLQGTIISYNLTGGMEFHNYPFNGNLPQNSNCCFNTDTTPTSPNTPSSTNAPVFCAKPCKVC
ncbi:choice-of-anchor A family protein, partial [Klebsiella pneumoniae]|nr:choice-of-anchor A family protein [Klebsiella pneumoniae]